MPLHPPSDERQLVGAALPRYPQIDAGLHPLRTMGCETAPTVPVLGQNMGEFVKQGFLHLLLGDGAQRRIEPDLRTGRNRHSCGRAHAGVPTHDQPGKEPGSKRFEMAPGPFL